MIEFLTALRSVIVLATRQIEHTRYKVDDAENVRRDRAMATVKKYADALEEFHWRTRP